MNYKVVQPYGLLDEQNANEIHRETNDLVADGADIILVDLQEITYMNSSAIQALMETLKLVTAEGGQLFLCSLNDKMRIIFELTRMDQMFRIFADRPSFEQDMIPMR